MPKQPRRSDYIHLRRIQGSRRWEWQLVTDAGRIVNTSERFATYEECAEAARKQGLPIVVLKKSRQLST